ncbi:hypothetical protein [Allohahella sp. A8]|uniref:hypothetical protein n=1 Tax=Allohahella sp. A8 TaxID=3141461 RepID=UPI003A8081D0|tara:strand:+ start:23068 stop:23268 length:201 start_codon:yes stop_codon:yes gene_type:complete
MTELRKTAYSAAMQYGCLEMRSDIPSQESRRLECALGFNEGAMSFEQYESQRKDLAEPMLPSFSYR